MSESYYAKMDPLREDGRTAVKKDLGGGRVVFGPGDKWPALLKITVHIFDPLDRLEGGRKAELIVAVP